MSSSGASPRSASPPRVGRYELLVRIGKGGMASVYLARVRSEAGFTRLYALKVLHPHLSEHGEFVDMLMDEARIASRLHHPNVVSTVDVGRDGPRHFLVMDYVEGVALDRLLRRHPERRPPELIVPVAIDALRGLHAAHRLTDEAGHPLELVHRDVTPGNVIVGADGTARIADFGVAKARARITKTHPGIVKGKAGYIAPEVVMGRDIDGRADVFAMGVVLWNALTGQTLFDTDDLASTLAALLKKEVPPPSTVGLEPPAIFDAPILGALHRDPDDRHESALEMAQALEDALMLHRQRVEREAIGAWVTETFGEQLAKRRRYAATPLESPRRDSVPAEPPSTSAMVRKDPSGRVVTAMPEPRPDVLDDPFAAPDAEGGDGPTTVSEPPPAALDAAEARSTAPGPEARDEEAERRPRQGRRWALVGGLALLAAGGLAGGWWWTQRPDPAMTARPLDAPAAEALDDDPPPPAAAPVDLSRDVLGREERAPAADAPPDDRRPAASAREAPARGAPPASPDAERNPSGSATPTREAEPDRTAAQSAAPPERAPAAAPATAGATAPERPPEAPSEPPASAGAIAPERPPEAPSEPPAASPPPSAAGEPSPGAPSARGTPSRRAEPPDAPAEPPTAPSGPPEPSEPPPAPTPPPSPAPED